jgi:hypothetical protein
MKRQLSDASGLVSFDRLAPLLRAGGFDGHVRVHGARRPPYVHAKPLAAKMEHKQEPEMTAAQARDNLIAFLIEHGVQIAPPLIEGEAEIIDRARIAGPDEQGEQGDKFERCAPRPSRRARP